MNWTVFFILEVLVMETGTRATPNSWQTALAWGLYGAFNLAVWASIRTHDNTISDPIAVMGLLGIPSALCLGIMVAGLPASLVPVVQWSYPIWALLAMIITGMGGLAKSDTTVDTLTWTVFPGVGLAATVRSGRRVS